MGKTNQKRIPLALINNALYTGTTVVYKGYNPRPYMKLIILSSAILINFYLKDNARFFKPAQIVVTINLKMLSAFP